MSASDLPAPDLSLADGHPLDAATLSRLEDAALNASATARSLWLDGWQLRLCPAKAKRARSIQPLCAGRLPLAERLAQAQAHYDAAGLPLYVRLTPFSPAGLDTALAQAGLVTEDDTRVMVHPDLAALPPTALPAGWQLEAVDAATYAEHIGALRGTPADQRAAHAERLRETPVRYEARLLRDADGQLLAMGQWAREGAAVGLYDIATPAALRGRGHARRLCAALLEQARAAGARVAYLQVESDNAPARALYDGLGFAQAYGYHYRRRP